MNVVIEFQSLDAIYRYDTLKKDVSSIKVDGDITKMVIIDDELYFHIKNAGLYKLVNGQQLLVNDSQLIKESILINLYNINKNRVRRQYMYISLCVCERERRRLSYKYHIYRINDYTRVFNDCEIMHWSNGSNKKAKVDQNP